MDSTLTIPYIRLFNTLKSKFSDKEAEEIVSLIKQQSEDVFETKKDVLATKADIAELKEELKKDNYNLEIKLAKTETRLTLWAFVFWATQLAAIFAFLKLVIVK